MLMFGSKQTNHSFTVTVKSGGAQIEDDISSAQRGLPYTVPLANIEEMVCVAYDAYRWNRDTRAFDFLKIIADWTLSEGGADAVRKALNGIEE